MTLSRGPYTELDKMSLFQNLKLKRRKVDSRCSSDGESVADTSTSSPDLITSPLSPKMCDREQNSREPPRTPTPSDEVSRQSSPTTNLIKSPKLVHATHGNGTHVRDRVSPDSPASFVDSQDALPTTTTTTSSIVKHEHELHSSVIQRAVHNERPHSASPISSQHQNHLHHHHQQMMNDMRAYQQQQQQQQLPPQQQHVTVLVTPTRIKTENNQNTNSHAAAAAAVIRNKNQTPPNGDAKDGTERNNRLTPTSTSVPTTTTTNSTNFLPMMIQSQMLSSQQGGGQGGQQQVQVMFHHPSQNILHRTLTAGQPPSSPGNNYSQHTSQSSAIQIPFHALSGGGGAGNGANNRTIKRERSPSTTNHNNVPVSSVQSSGSSPRQSPLSSVQSPIQIPFHTLAQQQQQQRSIKRERSPTSNTCVTSMAASPNRQSPASIRIPQQALQDAAVLFRVKSEMPPNAANLMQIQNRMWANQARINGVKPEVIGGPLPQLRTQPQATSSQQPQSSTTPPRATPTVIMGESCGVRTMVWGYESSPQVQNSNSSQVVPSPGPSVNNDEAAQLLLSLGQGRPNPRPSSAWQSHPLNMERLWAGDYSQLPAGQQTHALNLSSQQQWTAAKEHDDHPPDEDEQPLVCMICEDKATGLHYGIITCEGCKGFFKRTVQNRRVYTCVADGTCEITKAQRNRCQYCRFKKCIEQGMVLQAVREDRMPGGRNSGAVYNLYKVKYKKHKKSKQQQNQQHHHGHHHQQQQQQHQQNQQHQLQHQHQINQKLQSGDTAKMFLTSPPLTPNQSQTQSSQHQSQQQQQNNQAPPQAPKPESINLPSHLMNGTILKTALTNPSEIVHLRHRLDNAVSSSKDRLMPYDQACNMIKILIECDAMEDIATLPHFSEFLEDKSEIGDKLCDIGDSIVHKLVSWTKKLPFYLEIPVEIHTKLLTDKWHEILVLTTAAYQALHGRNRIVSTQIQQNHPPGIHIPDPDDPEVIAEITSHLNTLQTCLATLMGHPLSMEQLRTDVGQMVEKMTQITIMFRRIKLKMEEYVCLKVYVLLNQESRLENIQEKYVQALRSYLQVSAPHLPSRLNDLLAHIPEIQTAASLLLESKMFYVPFVLNSASLR